jgi:outer membrane protein
MKNSLKLFSLAIVFLFVSMSLSAQNQKIAYIDPEQIIPNMPEYKAAKSELEQYNSILQKQLEGEKAKMQQYYTDVMTKIQRGELSPAQQKTEEDKLMKMQEELQRKAMKMEEDMGTKELDLTKPMYEKFNDAMKTVAKANGFAYIFDKKMLLYSEGGEDLTAKLKAQLGIQ